MPEPKYHSYLLRLWQENGEKKPNWRFILINLAQNERRGFASLDRLVAFLKGQMDEVVLSDSAERNQVE